MFAFTRIASSLIAQLVKNHLQCRRPWFSSWVRKIHWRKDRLPPLYSWASLVAQLVKNLPVCRRPGLGRSPGEGKGYPLQYSSLDNSMGCIVHGVAKSRTLLSIFHLLEFKLHEGRKLDLFVY